MVLRAAEFPTIGIWLFTVRDPLPDIPIPLRDHQADVILSLKDCFDHAFEAGRWLMEIDYGTDLVPPLSPEDAKWTRSILSSLQIDRGDV